MRKCSILCLLVLLLGLMGGCSEDGGVLKKEKIFMRTETSVQEGHLFFTGEVLAIEKKAEQITYYDEPADQNTFYTVSVTDDYFGALPAKEITVCIYGTVQNNISRSELEEGKEYLFDVVPWVQGETVVFLLPTFYSALASRSEQDLYYVQGGTRYAIDATYDEYKEDLKEFAEGQGYAPATVLQKAKAQFEQAKERDVTYFKELKFKSLDTAAVEATVATAAKRLDRIASAEVSWEGVQGILK